MDVSEESEVTLAVEEGFFLKSSILHPHIWRRMYVFGFQKEKKENNSLLTTEKEREPRVPHLTCG